jgi:hypothetical protein
MITSIFSDRDEVEAVESLSLDDAQAFIDVIDEASSSSTQRTRSLNPSRDFTRCWIASRQRSEGDPCTIYPGAVPARACFQNRFETHPVAPRRWSHPSTVGLRTCERVNTMDKRLR